LLLLYPTSIQNAVNAPNHRDMPLRLYKGARLKQAVRVTHDFLIGEPTCARPRL
jgi:hypothetical protein